MSQLPKKVRHSLFQPLCRHDAQVRQLQRLETGRPLGNGSQEGKVEREQEHVSLQTEDLLSGYPAVRLSGQRTLGRQVLPLFIEQWHTTHDFVCQLRSALCGKLGCASRNEQVTTGYTTHVIHQGGIDNRAGARPQRRVPSTAAERTRRLQTAGQQHLVKHGACKGNWSLGNSFRSVGEGGLCKARGGLRV